MYTLKLPELLSVSSYLTRRSIRLSVQHGPVRERIRLAACTMQLRLTFLFWGWLILELRLKEMHAGHETIRYTDIFRRRRIFQKVSLLHLLHSRFFWLIIKRSIILSGLLYLTPRSSFHRSRRPGSASRRCETYRHLISYSFRSTRPSFSSSTTYLSP